MKGEETWNLSEVTVAIEPTLLEVLLLTPDNLEAIHRDEHSTTPLREGLPSISSAGEPQPILAPACAREIGPPPEWIFRGF
jgi:hypothetical protein